MDRSVLNQSDAPAKSKSSAPPQPTSAARSAATRSPSPVDNGDPDEVDMTGLLRDIEIVDPDEASQASREDRTRDIVQFCSNAFTEDGKRYRHCLICQ